MWRISHITISDDIKLLKDMGFELCNLSISEEEINRLEPERLLDILRSRDMDLRALWCSFGSCTYDLIDGPKTVGFVPVKYRKERLRKLEKCASYASRTGVKHIITHAGFIPEIEYEDSYAGVVKVLREAAEIAGGFGISLLLETGQETPVTLLRTIQDVNRDNIGVNLDTGNLIIYGRGDPCGALDTLKDYIWGVDAKDAMYPESGRSLGTEVCCGEGKVRFPELINKLFNMKYSGDIMIEREISGEQKLKDIIKAKTLLENIIHSGGDCNE
jgi:sugar phosphate isomerase/epimerase